MHQPPEDNGCGRQRPPGHSEVRSAETMAARRQSAGRQWPLTDVGRRKTTSTPDIIAGKVTRTPGGRHRRRGLAPTPGNTDAKREKPMPEENADDAAEGLRDRRRWPDATCGDIHVAPFKLCVKPEKTFQLSQPGVCQKALFNNNHLKIST